MLQKEARTRYYLQGKKREESVLKIWRNFSYFLQCVLHGKQNINSLFLHFYALIIGENLLKLLRGTRKNMRSK